MSRPYTAVYPKLRTWTCELGHEKVTWKGVDDVCWVETCRSTQADRDAMTDDVRRCATCSAPLVYATSWSSTSTDTQPPLICSSPLAHL